MIFRILCVLNQFEREVLSERTSAALHYKKQQGLIYGPIPYGYDRIGDKLVQNASEQRVLFKIRDWRNQG